MIGEDEPLHRAVIVAALGSATLILGFVGSLSYRPGNSFLSHAYWSLILLIGSFEPGPGAASPPVLLQIGRLLGLATLASAIIAVGTLALRNVFDDWRAGFQRSHVVVVGSSRDAVRIASAHAGRCDREGVHWWRGVAFVSDIEGRERRRLRWAGVVVARRSDRRLGKIADRSRAVIVCENSDLACLSTAAWLAEAAPEDESRSITVVVERPELADGLQPSGQSSVTPIVTYCSLPERLAWHLLRSHPPVIHGRCCPAPMVIGDTVLAREIALHAVGGWRRPAERMGMVCLAPSGLLDWRSDVSDALPGWSDVESPKVSWSVAGIAAEVMHQSGPAGAPHPIGAPGWPPVDRMIYLALGDDELALPLALRLVSLLDDVVVVVTPVEVLRWRDLPPLGNSGRILVHGVGDTPLDLSELVDGAWIDRLAESILVRHGSAPVDIPSVLDSPPGVDSVHVAAMLAATASAAFRAADIELTGNGLPVVPGPAELNLMAATFREHLGPMANDAYALLEFCSGLPQLLAAVGVGTTRPRRSAHAIDDSTIDRLAQATHDIYRRANGGAAWNVLGDFAKESNRAFARDIPVKLAALDVGLGPKEQGTRLYEFSPRQVSTLSRREHDRWLQVHRLAGYRYGPRDDSRRVHPDLRPWEDLEPSTRAKDTDLVSAIPEMLAEAGLAIRGGVNHVIDVREPQPATPRNSV